MLTDNRVQLLGLVQPGAPTINLIGATLRNTAMLFAFSQAYARAARALSVFCDGCKVMRLSVILYLLQTRTYDTRRPLKKYSGGP